MASIAIIGSRTFNNFPLLSHVVSELCSKRKFDTVVSGGAAGADTLGTSFAIQHGMKVKIFLPEYNLFGRRAPIVRNIDIVNNADYVLAFWDGKSKGTFHAINYARRCGKEIQIEMIQ